MTGSSPEENVSAQAEPVIQDVSTAESSVAETQGEMSLVDSVLAELNKGEKESSPGSAPDPEVAGSTTAETPATPEEEPLGEITEDELKGYVPRTQKRIRQLWQKAHDADTRATAAEEKASRFDQIVEYSKVNGLSNEDVTTTFEIAALLRNEPEKAYEKVLPIFLHLSQLTGKVLPPEMQQKVELGYLPESDARELVRLKTQTALVEARAAEQARQTESERQLAAQRNLVREATDATAAWEEQRSKTDPDWSSKKELVLEFTRSEIATKGFPASKAQMVELLNSVSARVDQQVARFRPAPRAVTPVTGASSARASAEPTSAVEAAMIALGAAR